jgi:hypothetical protein
MTEQIDQDVANCDRKWEVLSVKAGAIESKVALTTPLLKEVAERPPGSQIRLPTSRRLTGGTGSSIRTFLFIGFFVAFLGALRLFWR